MLQRLEINGIHLDVDENLHKYITRKIGHMDKYLPRPFRESAHAEVRLHESVKGSKKTCKCEVTFRIPGNTIEVSESTINMYAAVDIVESKLKNQIIKVRERHALGGKQKRHFFARLRRKSGIRAIIEPEAELL
jgi:ribosomal subunit interface protein